MNAFTAVHVVNVRCPLDPSILQKLIDDYFSQVLVNYARSSKEAEEVCKEVTLLLLFYF